MALSPGTVNVSMQETIEISNAVVELLMRYGPDNQACLAALCMALGRITAPVGKNNTFDDDIKFVQDLTNYIGMYWFEGKVN